jgi:hypothetical protein
VFCPKTERAKHTLTLDEFDALTSRLEGEVKFLYFHLMGEPFLHLRSRSRLRQGWKLFSRLLIIRLVMRFSCGVSHDGPE